MEHSGDGFSMANENAPTDAEKSSDETLEAAADDVEEQLADNVDVERDKLIQRLSSLMIQYKVPQNEAVRSVRKSLHKEAGIDDDDTAGDPSKGNDTVPLAEIDEEEQWIDLPAVRVVDLWEPNSDSVAQVGLIGDESGTLKFTKWAKSDLPTLEKGKCYALNNVVTDEWQGRYSVKLNRTTEINEIDEDVEVGDDATELEGAAVSIKSGEGLIKRCPKEGCTRVLENGRCSEHGDVEGEFDLRLKVVLDDGSNAQDVIFDDELTTELTGIDLDDAQAIAQENFEQSDVLEAMKPKVGGYYYRVKGPVQGRYLLANEVERLDSQADAPMPDPEEALIRARSI